MAIGAGGTESELAELKGGAAERMSGRSGPSKPSLGKVKMRLGLGLRLGQEALTRGMLESVWSRGWVGWVCWSWVSSGTLDTAKERGIRGRGLVCNTTSDQVG